MTEQGELRIRPASRPTLVDPAGLRLEAEDELPEAVPVSDEAIRPRSASFAQVAEAFFYRQEKFNSDPSSRPMYERRVTPLTKAFEIAHGKITHAYYCKNIRAAAALTTKDELHVVDPSIDSKHVIVAEILLECDRLNVESDRVLGDKKKKEREKDLRTTKLMIYAVITKLFSLLDENVTPSRSLMALYWREARDARDYYLRAAIRYAKLDYIRGMSLGILLVAAVAIVAFILLRYALDLEMPGKILAASLTAGGIGAVVSVMSRMTFGELVLDYEAGSTILRMLGVFRPLIGMVMGTAMWVLSESGVLTIGPSTSDKRQYFYVLVAFLAGFSERWAQDMLGRAVGEIGGRGKRAAAGKGEIHRSEGRR